MNESKHNTPLPILVTKVESPRFTAALLERPRLLALLPLVETRQLTVIKGPAGFAKTSLAVAWAEHLRQNGDKVAWLSLDPEDDEPTRFVYYVAHALQRACERVGTAAIAMISDVSLVPPRPAVSSLINELAELDDELFLFVDDYHHISNQIIHDELAFLLRHASANFHLVLTSRSDPELPVARLRAQNQLLEVDASALSFDLAETRRFLAQQNLRELNATELSVLHATTGGWPAAIRLVASASLHREGGLQLSVRASPSMPRSAGAYIEDVLATLPPQLVVFMERTSILDRFNASLCDTVTGSTSSQDMLETMLKRQLLLTPLGQDESWLRYHPLLAEFLRQRLQTRHRAVVPELHRRAAQWFAAQEFWTEAVAHALAAHDTDQALAWMQNCAMAMVKRGELLTLLAWQRQFPVQLMRGQLRVRLALAWGMALAMRFDDSLALLADIEQDVDGAHTPAHEQAASECETIRAVVFALQDDSVAALSLAGPCLQRRSADAWNTNVASNVARFGNWKAGDIEAFYAVPWLPYSAEDDRRNVLSQVYRLCILGLVEFDQLRIGVAERYFLDALRRGEQFAGSQSTAAALPASLIARIRFEEDHLDEAESLITERLPLINATAMLECVLSTYLVLARIEISRSNGEHARALLEQAATLGYTRRWGRLVAAVEVERVKQYLAEGRGIEASACLIQLDRLVTDYPAPTRGAWSEIGQYRSLAHAHVALAKGAPTEAIAILRTLAEDTRRVHANYFGIGVETLLATALLEADEPDKALELFEDVIMVAAPTGIYRSILHAGPRIGYMLLQLKQSAPRRAHSKHLPAYVDQLLEGWRRMYHAEPVPDQELATTDLLTARERRILELIAEGRSNKEIARSLGIAPETVKSHMKHIFEKLSVEKRAQAIARAQRLGLLRSA